MWWLGFWNLCWLGNKSYSAVPEGGRAEGWRWRGRRWGPCRSPTPSCPGSPSPANNSCQNNWVERNLNGTHQTPWGGFHNRNGHGCQCCAALHLIHCVTQRLNMCWLSFGITSQVGIDYLKKCNPKQELPASLTVIVSVKVGSIQRSIFRWTFPFILADIII